MTFQIEKQKTDGKMDSTGMRVLENNALESNRQNRRFSLAMPNLIDMGFRKS